VSPPGPDGHDRRRKGLALTRPLEDLGEIRAFAEHRYEPTEVVGATGESLNRAAKLRRQLRDG
jgi:hypothetical protein